MPECRCRTEAADYRKKYRCRTNFSPAFRYLHMIFQYRLARITPSAAVYGRAGCIPFDQQQYGRAGCIHFRSQQYVQGLPLFLNAGMSDCPSFIQSGIGTNKMRMPEPVRYQNKGTWSGTGMLRYRTEIQDAGMPAASTSCPAQNAYRKPTVENIDQSQRREF